MGRAHEDGGRILFSKAESAFTYLDDQRTAAAQYPDQHAGHYPEFPQTGKKHRGAGDSGNYTFFSRTPAGQGAFGYFCGRRLAGAIFPEQSHYLLPGNSGDVWFSGQPVSSKVCTRICYHC